MSNQYEARADTLSDNVRLTSPAEDTRNILINKISWGAVAAGVVVALIIQFMLSLLGVGIGLATIDPSTGSAPDAGTFSIVSAVWYGVTGIISAFAGGFLASRLSGRPLASTGGLHGITTWAATTLVLLFLLTTAIGGLVGGVFSGLSSIAGGVGGAVNTVAQTAAPGMAGIDPFAMIEGEISQATGGTDPAALRDAAVSAVRAALTGDAAAADQAKETAAAALARSQNISIEQARTQVETYQTQYTAAVENARTQAVAAADAAAAATSTGAIAAFFVLLLGAVAAWFGGRVGVPKTEIGDRLMSTRA